MSDNPSSKALAFFNQAEETIVNLYCRWQDEKEYEDIKDYQKPLNSIADAAGVAITKMNKRPFGCNFTVDGKTFVLKMTARQYSYQRIK